MADIHDPAHRHQHDAAPRPNANERTEPLLSRKMKIHVLSRTEHSRALTFRASLLDLALLRGAKRFQVARQQFLLVGLDASFSAHFRHPGTPLRVAVFSRVVKLVTAGALGNVMLRRIADFLDRKPGGAR